MPLNRVWAVLGRHVATAVNHLLLGFFFYGILTPTGLVARAFGAIGVSKGPDPQKASYWTEVGRRADAESYRDLF